MQIFFMKNLMLGVVLLSTTLGFAQYDEYKIPWKEDKKLSWSDFKAAPDDNSNFHASTSSGLSFSWSLKKTGKDSEFIYEVGSSFHPDHSWVKEGAPSDYLLAHEQLHFDITELFARKLRKELASFKPEGNVKRDLNRLYQLNERERDKMQKLFDRESQHSLHKEYEAKWQEYVRRELKKLEKFSS